MAGVLVGRNQPVGAPARDTPPAADGRSPRPVETAWENSVPARADDDARIGRVFSALQEPVALRKRSELFEALRDLTAQDLPALVQRAEALPFATRWNEQFLPALVERWIELDFDAARDWLRANPRNFFWVTTAFAQANPDAAIQEALATSNDYRSTRLLTEALKALAGSDAQAQVAKLRTLPNVKLRDNALTSVLRELAKTDAPAAWAALSEISSSRARDSARDEILTEWASRDPAAALVQLRGLLPTLQPSVLGNELITRIAEHAGEKAPRLVLDWLSEIPVEFRSAPAIAAARVWAAKEPAAALAWCMENGVDVARGRRVRSGGWMAGVLGEALAAQPAATIEWLEARPAGPDRDRLLERALEDSIWRVPPEQLFGEESAFAMRLFNELAEESQVRTATALGRKRAEQSDFTDLRDWAENFAVGPARANALAGAMAAAYGRDASRVDALLASAATAADRDAALRGLAGAMSDAFPAVPAAPADAAARALEISDPELRRETLGTVFTAWQKRDADAASAWLRDTATVPAAWKQEWQRPP